MGKAKREKGRKHAEEKRLRNVTLAGKVICADGRCLETVDEVPECECQLCHNYFCGNHLYRVFHKVTKKQISLPREPLQPGEIAPPPDDVFCNKCGDKLQAKV